MPTKKLKLQSDLRQKFMLTLLLKHMTNALEGKGYGLTDLEHKQVRDAFFRDNLDLFINNGFLDLNI